jgi:hypothetical protein
MSIQRSETSIHQQTTGPENMHAIDRVTRIAFGIGLAATLHPALSIVDAPYEDFLPLLAIYPLLTGLLAWDPIYALLRVRTNTISDPHAIYNPRTRSMENHQAATEAGNVNTRPGYTQHDPLHKHLAWALVIATTVLIANAVIVVALGGAG